jgi:hypothetical protein
MSKADIYWADRLHTRGIAAGIPSGYTNRWTTPSAWAVQAESVDGPPADKEIKLTTGSLAWFLGSFDAMGQRRDIDLLALVKTSDVSGSSTHGGIAIRCSGSAASENGVYLSFRSASGVGTALRMAKLVGGTDTLLSNITLAWTAGSWFWFRLRGVGTAFKGKGWAFGNAEPAAWGAEVTDSASEINAAGYAGMMCRTSTGNPAFGYIAAGLGGRPAPRF